MKGLFPEYDNGRATDYTAVWKDALFVFDTNVLLNLYRYRVGTRDELLAVLDKITDRIWIPYQVALEFQRNRLSVIAEQVKRFSEVKRTIGKAQAALTTDLGKLRLQERHSLINPDPLLSGLKALTENFSLELEKLQKNQQTLSGEDQLKNRLEALFSERVGPAIADQKQLDTLYKEGEARYKVLIPPGYEDDWKDIDGPDEFVHAGLFYKKKYGDYIIWKQMLEHCKSIGTKSLIFVTDDNKEDWWRVLDVDGPKTIGPRPELIDEARRDGGVENFLMYSSSNFLKHAKSALLASVSDAAIEEVKEISSTVESSPLQWTEEKRDRGLDALRNWLLNNSDTVLNGPGPSELTAIRDGKRYAYILALPYQGRGLRIPSSVIRELTGRIQKKIMERDDDVEHRFVIVWLADSRLNAVKMRKDLLYSEDPRSMDRESIRVMIATLNDPDTGAPGFFVQAELTM
jgi:predicted nucleic acid-binding protein